MEYKIGDKAEARINKIQDNGCYCTLKNSKQFGFIPKYLMLSLFDRNGNFEKKIGDNIIVVLNKFGNKGCLILSEISYQERKDFAVTYDAGTVFEVEVVHIYEKEIAIKCGNVDGIIKAKDTNWNVNDNLENIVFEKEILNAVFLKEKNGFLYFGLKQLKEKPYDEDLYHLDIDELLAYIGQASRIYIGQAKQYSYGLFIENLYSVSDKQKGKILSDPIYGHNIRAFVHNEGSFVEDGKYYKVELSLLPKAKRIKRNQLFQFGAKVIEETSNPYKEDVDLTFSKSTSPRDCTALAHTLAEVGKNMYSSKDRMFFELIQNADDAAPQKGVHIDVKTSGDYLIVRHDGYSFDKDDFDAITSSANGTKKANENKTGYKGIGFKSVFTDSDVVYIKTGGYQFKFDKKDPRFSNFEDFYFAVNGIIDDEQRKIFLQKFSSERLKFRGVADIPWQLEPIWIDGFPEELRTDFVNSNVSIGLQLGEHKIGGDNGYGQAIMGIISNPRFMLFLRNTKRIDFNGLSVSKTTNDGNIALKNSFHSDKIECFKREDFEILVNNTTLEKNGIDIKIAIEKKDDFSGKIIEAKFIDSNNIEIENIPKKIAINSTTEISFAIPVGEDRHVQPNLDSNDISLYAFLPTLVKDFKFPFYINANFILDPPRQRILGDNPWNFYLMQEIARNMVRWSASLNERKDKNALNILLSQYFEENSTDTRQLSMHFNRAYKSALENERFILNYDGTLSKIDEIILDIPGLSNLVGEELFCKFMGTEKKLPSKCLDSSILQKGIFSKMVETYRLNDVLERITENSNFNDWFSSASEEQKNTLYRWINWIEEKGIEPYNGCLKRFVSGLPLFDFGIESITNNDVNFPTNIITTELIVPIRAIMVKLGFDCSDNTFETNHPLYKFIELPDGKDLFDAIKNCNFSDLTSCERRTLFFSLADFKGVGDAKLKDIALFRNINGVTKPLGEMVAYRDNVPLWLSDYVLCKEDDDTDLSDYLISQGDEFENIIQKHIEEIDTPIAELYKFYKDEWTGQFTRKIIDKYEIEDELLAIIEESDTKTKEYFLSSIKKLELFSTSTYKKGSYEYRVLRLVLSVYSEPSDFSSKIYFDGQCIKDFSVSDDVVCDFYQNGENKKVKLSLAKLLPQYQNQSDSIEKVKALFETKKDLDKFFQIQTKTLSDIYRELNNHLQIPESFSLWYNRGNAQQYLFSTYYRRQCKGWYDYYVPKIDLDKESESFVYELLDFLYGNKISIKSSPFTYHLHGYFEKRYIDSFDYTFANERLLKNIEEWANVDSKKKIYLIDNGVQQLDCNTIQFRKLFLENNVINFIEKLTDEDIRTGIDFIVSAKGYVRPFVGQHQSEILLSIPTKIKELSRSWNEEKIKGNANELETDEYKKWSKNHSTRIFIYHGILPCQLLYKNELLLDFDNTKEDYYFNTQEQKLFLCSTRGAEDILFEIAKEGTAGLDFNDYRELCLDGKTIVSKEDIDQKDRTIESLEKENRRKDEIIEQYRALYGNLKEEESKFDDNGSIPNLDKFDNDHHEITEQTFQVVNRDGLSQKEQKEAHREAERVVKVTLENKGYDCSCWIIDDDNDNTTQEWQSTSQIKNIKTPDGSLVDLIYVSAKGGYIYLSATDFDFLTSNTNNLLMVWDGKTVHSVTAEDIFNKDSNVNLIFDTEYTPKHYYAALSKVFQYIKRTTFAVKNPSYNAYDTIKSFGMDSKTEGVQKLFDDNDL